MDLLFYEMLSFILQLATIIRMLNKLICIAVRSREQSKILLLPNLVFFVCLSLLL